MCPIFANEDVPDIPAGFMNTVTDTVHREGGLVISDEVQSEYGRTGHWWAYESNPVIHVSPDGEAVTDSDKLLEFGAR